MVSGLTLVSNKNMKSDCFYTKKDLKIVELNIPETQIFLNSVLRNSFGLVYPGNAMNPGLFLANPRSPNFAFWYMDFCTVRLCKGCFCRTV